MAMPSASNPSLPLQLRNKDLGSKLKRICKRGFEAAAQVDPQLMATTAQIISQLTNGMPIASQISQVITFIVGTGAASFETSDKLNEVQHYAEELQKNIYQLRTDDGGDLERWVRQALPKLYAEAYSLNKSRQGCISAYKLFCAQHINVQLDRLVNTMHRLNNDVNQLLIKDKQNQMFDRHEKPSSIAADLPASVDDILAGKAEVLEFLNVGKPGIRVLCIVGMGGVGKTTMVDALHHLILHEEAKAAMAKVEIGKDLVMALTQIQQKIVNRLEGKNEEFDGVAQGQSRLKRCFKTLQQLNRPLCLCIDNVWKDKHLTELFGHFGMYKYLPSSSYLIITTRMKRVAESFRCLFSSKAEECMEYNLQKLSLDKAKQLFKRYGEREGEYLNDELVNTIVPLCDGLPLALRVYATLFRRHKKEKTNYMNVAMRIKEARDSDSNADDDELFPALETSIDFQKEYVIRAFIDAVLFWRNRPYNEARHALMGIHGRETRFDLDCLCEDSIIEQGKDGELKCHDLFVPLARKKAAERNWIYIDVKETRISLNQQAQQRSLAISDLHSKISGRVRAISTTGMSCPSKILELLLQYFDVSDPRFISFRSDILYNATFSTYLCGLQNLLALYITEDKDYDKQTKIQIQNLRLPYTLRMLSLQFISPMLPSAIGQLAALQTLVLRGCKALAVLPDSIGQLAALQTLDLAFCHSLPTLPDPIGQLATLQMLVLRGCEALTALPDSIGQLVALQTLDLAFCHSLAALPDSIGQLAALQTLVLRDCETLPALPESIGQLATLQSLILAFCQSLVALPDSIGQLAALQSLVLAFCHSLVALPDSIGQLAALQTLDLRYCDALAVLPDSIDQLPALVMLDLDGCYALDLSCPVLLPSFDVHMSKSESSSQTGDDSE